MRKKTLLRKQGGGGGVDPPGRMYIYTPPERNPILRYVNLGNL